MRKLITLIAVFVTATMASLASAATCTTPSHDNIALGDTLYSPRVCNQAHIDKFWKDFSFEKGDWDEGFGFDDVCNIATPLNRTFSGLWALLFSSPDPATSTHDFNGNFLRWAYNYSARAIDELDARCGDNSAYATTFSGLFADDRTVLYLPFFYGLSIPERAGTIVHEARHADGRSHDSCWRTGPSCPLGGSCDSHWQDGGANSYEVIYLWWFVDSGVNTTTAMKRRAQDQANGVLSSAFCTPTSFRLGYSL